MHMLKDPRLVRQLAYVNGKWIAGHGGRDEAVIDPASEETIGRCTQLDASQVEHAIDAAQAALPGWRALSVDARGVILGKWHDLLLENKEDLARLMTLEQGKPLDEARGEIDYAASFIRWFAEEARRAYGETIPSHIRNAQLGSVREPIGVAALITPWNFPCAMITRKAAAALAVGCTVLVKPAGETPFSALALAELAERAGFPAGVFNVITGEPEMVSQVLCASDKVKALSFTGSTRVGRLLLQQAAATVKKCSMELGGNAPFIVLPDMDVEEAAQAAIDAKFQTTGQDCLAANRIFVHRSLYEPFLAAFARRMGELTVGNGLAWDDLEQLIAQANDTEYGLAAYVYGHDMRPVWQLLRGLEFGMVSVNSVKMTGPPVPFGGVKQSGLGREGSRHGLDEYSQIKYYCLGGLPSASGS